jgi:coenzyme F420-0:L-glutamate ligase/coenzyme F420-1:gamma-L-glutamate ligase
VSDGLRLFGITGIGEVRAGDDLAALLVDALTDAGRPLLAGDVLVVSSKVVSKAEGRVVAADTRDAQIVAETVRPVAARRTPRGLAWIVESAAGPVMAAAGVDASNVAPGTVLLLPQNPDASARALRSRVRELTGLTVGVIVSDTAGRAWRAGQVDFALGAAGVAVTDDLRGSVDTHGQSLETTVRALADELAAAADLIKGKLTGLPAAVARGTGVTVTEEDGPGAATLLRPAREDWFRYGHVEAVTASLGGVVGVVEPPTVPAGTVEERFARVLSLGLLTPGPWIADFLGRSRGAEGTATLVDADGSPRTAVSPADWAALGALAQRLTAAAWAEDLTLEIDLDEGPPSRLRIQAADR